MKFIIGGDLHLDTRNPENRKGDFFADQYHKMIYIHKLAREYGCELAVFPGDVYNSHRANDWLKSFYIGLLKHELEMEFLWLVVWGQHDMRYHSSDRRNTPLHVMQAAGNVLGLGHIPYKRDGVHFYGMNWGENIPEIIPPEKLGVDYEPINVLVAHMMVIENEKAWTGQTDYRYGLHLLKQHDFDLIITGDNHQSFNMGLGEKYLVNAGALMRTRIDQFNHKPTVYVYDSETKDLHGWAIPVKDFEEIMDIAKAEAEQKIDEKLQSFVSSLKVEVDALRLDFQRNLVEFLKNNEVEQSVTDIIVEATTAI